MSMKISTGNPLRATGRVALGLGVAMLVLAVSGQFGNAAVRTWTGTTSADWSVGGAGGNWNGAAAPVSTDGILFNNLSTANLATNNNLVGSLLGIELVDPTGPVSIGGNNFTVGAGGIDLSAATQNLTISPTLTLTGTQSLNVASGRQLTVSATPSLAAGAAVSKDGDGTVAIGSSFYVGNNVSNTFNMNAGTLTSGNLRIGQGTGKTGTLNQTGGVINANLFIAGGISRTRTGTGVYNISGGSLTSGTLYCGWGSDGEIYQSGGVVTTNNLESATDGVDGYYELSAGQLTVTSRARLGYLSGYQTDFVQTGGTASFKDLMLAGRGGTGSAGTGNYTISGSGQLTITSGGMLAVGYNEAGVGNLNVDGGTVQVNAPMFVGREAGTTGTVTQTAGTVTIDSTHSLRFGNSAAATGSYNLNGGTLTLAAIEYSDTTIQHLNINGGTLQANGNLNTTMPIALSGGATIDTQANTVTLGGVLSGSGGLRKYGSGTLTLTGDNSFATNVYIYDGTLKLDGGDDRLNPANRVWIEPAGTFDLNGQDQTVYSIRNKYGVLRLSDGATLTITGYGDFWSSSTITGSGSLRKTVGNTAHINGNADYTGGTFIEAGIVGCYGGNDRLPTTGEVNISGSGTFSLASSGGAITRQTIGPLNGSGTVSITRSSGATVEFIVGSGDGSGAFSGTIQDGTGTVSLTKTGSGTQILSGTNTYTGGTTVSGGTLQGNTNGLQGAITNNAAVVFDQDFDGTYGGVLGGSGTLTKSGTGAVTLSGGNSYAGITSINQGTLKLGNANALGTTTAGTVVASGAALDLAGQTVGSEAVAMIGSGIAAGGALNNSSTSAASLAGNINLGGNASIVADAGKITLGGSLSTSAYQLTVGGSGDVDKTGATFNIGSGGQLIKEGSGTLTISGSQHVGPGRTFTHKAGTTIINGAYGVYTYGGGGVDGIFTQEGGDIYATSNYCIIGGGGSGLNGKGIYNMQGGTLTVSSRLYCGWNGSAEINQTGGVITTLNMDSATDGGDGVYNLSDGSLIVTETATLGFRYQTDFVQSGGSVAIKNLRLGGGASSAGTANYTLSGSGQLEITSGGSFAIGYNNGGTGNLYVNGGTINAHADVQVGAAANTNGTVTQTDGHVTIDAANALRFRSSGAYAGAYNLGGGTLTLAAIDYTDTATQQFNFDGGTLQANGTLNTTMPMTINAGGATVDSNGNGVTLGGPMTGAGGLTKSGSGTLTLTSGANAYGGTTTIGQGTLALGSGASIATSPVIDVQDGANFDVSAVSGGFQLVSGQKLMGTGNVLGDLTLLDGSTHAPGNSPGIQSIVGNYTLEVGSTLEIELNGTTVGSGYDQVNVDGEVNLAGTLELLLGFDPAVSDIFTIIANDGSDAVLGQFAGLAEGAEVLLSHGGDSYSFILTYQGNDGNDVVLANVPEPSTVMLLLLGILPSALRRRRRIREINP